jgi:hypothetical protein
LAHAGSRPILRAEDIGVRSHGLGIVITLLAACGGLAGASSSLGAATKNGPPPRPPPPIFASHCAGLTQDELREAREYLFKVTRIEPMYRDDASSRVWYQGLSVNPMLLIGVTLYTPAERCFSAAYLERLLSCHALQPPDLRDHPNDPLFGAGIISVDVQEADGGQYRISILAQRREQGTAILERARALQQSSGSVRVRQLEAPSAAPSQ